MAKLVIRDLDEVLFGRLRERARQESCTVEALACRLLEDAFLGQAAARRRRQALLDEIEADSGHRPKVTAAEIVALIRAGRER